MLTQYYTATTLDGFIADPNNSLDWLFTRQQDPDGPMNYKAFIADVGALAMGSTTYEWILDHEFAGQGAGGVEVAVRDAVLGLHASRAAGRPRTRASSSCAGTSRPVHEEMVAAAGDRNVWVVGGGDLAGQFADAGLLDEVIVSIAPVTLGAGAPLLPRRVELHFDEVGQNGDFAAAKYSVVR